MAFDLRRIFPHQLYQTSVSGPRIVMLLYIVEACWACRINLVSDSSWFEYSSGTHSICSTLPFMLSARKLWPAVVLVQDRESSCVGNWTQLMLLCSCPGTKISWTVRERFELYHLSWPEWHQTSIFFPAQYFYANWWVSIAYEVYPTYLGFLCWADYHVNNSFCQITEYLSASAITPYHQAKLHLYFRERHHCSLHNESIRA